MTRSVFDYGDLEATLHQAAAASIGLPAADGTPMPAIWTHRRRNRRQKTSTMRTNERCEAVAAYAGRSAAFVSLASGGEDSGAAGVQRLNRIYV
jgi:hypothetical protein